MLKLTDGKYRSGLLNLDMSQKSRREYIKSLLTRELLEESKNGEHFQEYLQCLSLKRFVSNFFQIPPVSLS